MNDSRDLILTSLYELGFLDKNGNPERNKEKRWKMNCNEATLILQDALREVKMIERFINKRLDDYWKETLHAHGKDYLAGYEDALLDVRQFIKKYGKEN